MSNFSRLSTRRGDPGVSFDAARRLTKISQKQKRVLRAIEARGRSLFTRWHIEEDLPQLGGHQSSTIRSRIAELLGIGAPDSTTRVWPPKVVVIDRQMKVNGRWRDCIMAAKHATDDELSDWMAEAVEQNAARR